MTDEGSGTQPRKIRDHIDLIQKQFQELLTVMIDAIGLIQRDAAVDPTKPRPDGRLLMTYDQIPDKAKQVVAHTLRIDALIQEAIDKTLLGEGEEEILASLKKESDEYKEGVESLSEENMKAEVWIDRMKSLMDVVMTQTFGVYDNKCEEELLE
jgi:hypothetical protein